MKHSQTLGSWAQLLQRDMITMPEPAWLPQDNLFYSFQGSKGIQGIIIMTEGQAAKEQL